MERNKKCWCGSGKKYKYCHLTIEEKIESHRRKGEIVPSRQMLKTEEKIKKIKESAALNNAVLDEISSKIAVGMNTGEIDRIVYDFTTKRGGIPATLNYEGFPYSVCTSVNDQVCHGFPSEDVILKSGDIVTIPPHRRGEALAWCQERQLVQPPGSGMSGRRDFK